MKYYYERMNDFFASFDNKVTYKFSEKEEMTAKEILINMAEVTNKNLKDFGLDDESLKELQNKLSK